MTGRSAGATAERRALRLRAVGFTAAVIKRACKITYARAYRLATGHAVLRTDEIVALYRERPVSTLMLVRYLGLSHDDVRVAALRNVAAECGCVECKIGLPGEKVTLIPFEIRRY